MSNADTDVNLPVLKATSGTTMYDITMGTNNQAFEGDETKEGVQQNVSGQPKYKCE